MEEQGCKACGFVEEAVEGGRFVSIDRLYTFAQEEEVYEVAGGMMALVLSDGAVEDLSETWDINAATEGDTLVVLLAGEYTGFVIPVFKADLTVRHGFIHVNKLGE